MRVKETIYEAIKIVSICERDEFVFKAGVKWQQERICDDEIINLIRHSLSNAEARRIIKEKTI